MSVANRELRVSTSMRERRHWSWAALLFAVVVGSLSIPTFGMTVFLAPVGLLLSVVAWRRAAHDALFWIGLALNVLSFVSLLGILVGLLTGDVAIGFE